MLAQALDPWASGVLDKEVHRHLVLDIDNFARDAAIQPRFICEPLANAVKQPVVTWVRRFKFHAAEGCTGLALTGKTGAEDAVAAIAGALVRNFIRARVFTAGTLVEMIENHEMVEATCLLIPNFFVAKDEGGTLAPWRVHMLGDLLVERHMRGLQTVIGVSSMTKLKVEYGTALHDHIENHYEIVKV